MKFGIDFGTSFSTMCALNDGGRPEVLRDGNGDDKIPSVVYWGKDGIKVGRAAVDIMDDAASMDGDERVGTLGRVIKSVKRDLEPGRMIALPDGNVIDAVDVVAEILGYMKRNAEELHFHGAVTEVSLTHPATFTEEQKNLLTRAAKKAGFSEVRLLPEPIAAALGHVASGKSVGNGIIVFDLGGGTFDLAYIQKNGDGSYHFPVRPLGDARCGGDDFDQVIYDWAEKKLQEKAGKDASFSDDFNVNLTFLTHCRNAKEKLSRNNESSLRYFVESNGRVFAESLSRTVFEELISGKVDSAIGLVGRMMNILSSRNLPVDTVLLVGGSTRIPLIAEKLKGVFPVEPVRTQDTDTAVVCGSVYELPIAKTTSDATSPDVLSQVETALKGGKNRQIPPLLEQVQRALLRRTLESRGK